MGSAVLVLEEQAGITAACSGHPLWDYYERRPVSRLRLVGLAHIDECQHGKAQRFGTTNAFIAQFYNLTRGSGERVALSSLCAERAREDPILG
jgi:hypothetical protein